MNITKIMKELGIGWEDINIPENLNEAEDIIIYGEEGGEVYGVK